jgi:hypothetical protein
MRKEAEPLHNMVWTDIGMIPLIGIASIALILTCCFSLCYCVASSVKGAYDDLHAASIERSESVDDLEEPLIVRQTPMSSIQERSVETPPENVNTNEVITEQTELLNTSTAEASSDPRTEASAYITAASGRSTDSIMEGSQVVFSRRYRASPRRSRHMQRLFGLCTSCYVVQLALIGAFVYGSIRYFPKQPVYNICNDAVAWKSLIDSVTSLKPSADFEILGSISNPNHLTVALEGGHGSFTHDGAFVGTFDIPPFQAKAMSISDFMIIAHLLPEKWEALSLAAEYYRGKLVLHIDTHISVRVPALGGYTFDADVKDMVVNVNELSDRSLCACPDWSHSRNKSRPLLEIASS